jgi:hypothetical protein
MPDTNAMQVNVGLGAAGTTAAGILTPAEAAIKLNEQAIIRQTQSQQIMQGTTLGMPSVAAFNSQFKAEMERIQMQQMSPYAAQALAQMTPSQPQYQQQMLPSPLMMTPPSTGSFRPPTSAFGQAAIPPMQALSPLSGISPFQPQRPAPMFNTPADIRQMESDVNAYQNFSMAAQVPRIAGQTAAFAGTAAIGAKLGSRFGPMGAVAGAVGGAALAGFSGLARGAGELAQMPMAPMMQQQQMSAALQRTTRNFVITGPQLHERGQGLTRQASLDLARGFQDMSEDKGFQRETGGMFNAQDLMKITSLGGQAGLMDAAQSVPQIKQKVKETASTIQKFMAITNDPDITNVIRQMGQMRQMGMTQQDMTNAAQGMKAYARMAGTSVQGIQQMGGVPGAAIFSQAGMTPATGFNYGNFAAASARQYVASGGVGPRELALMGGVSGITQRDIQAQAAYTAMPMYAMSNAQWTGGGGPAGQWGLNQGAVGGTQGGAFGMVRNALSAARQGVQEGGLGSLAMMPMQQREISDLAMRQMAPEQAMAQRFGSVQETAKMLGLEGASGFGAAAQMMFGPEVGEQMWRQAKSPEFWAAQRQQVRRRKDALAMRQAADRESRKGVLEKIGGVFGFGEEGRAIGKAWDEWTPFSDSTGLDVTGTISRGVSGAWESVKGGVSDFFLDENVVRRHIPKSTAIDTAKERKGLREFAERRQALDYSSFDVEGEAEFNLDIEDTPDVGRAMAYGDNADVADAYDTGASVGGKMIDAATLIPRGAVGLATAGAVGGKGRSIAEGAQGIMEMVFGGEDSVQSALKAADVKRNETLKTLRGAKKMSEADSSKALAIMKKLKGDKAYEIMAQGGAKSASGFDDVLGDGPLTAGKMEQVARQAYDINAAEWKSLAPEERQVLTQQAVADASASDIDIADRFANEEGEVAKGLAESADRAAEMSAESHEETMEGLEKDAGMTTKVGFFSMDTAGAQKIREAIQGDQSVMETVLLAAVGKEDGYEEAKAKYMEVTDGKGTEEDFYKRWKSAQKKHKGLSKEEQKLYKGMDLQTAGSMAYQTKKATMNEAMRTFAGEMGEYADSDKLAEITNQVGGKLTGKQLADAMTDEGLRKMISEGKVEEAQMYVDAQAGDTTAIAKIEQRAIEDAAEGTTKDKAAVEAEGDEAKKLENAESALENMSAMFAEFKPAIKDFKYATGVFKEAVDADAFVGKTE